MPDSRAALRSIESGADWLDQRIGDATESDGPRVRLARGDTIAPECVRWLWDGWLAAGKFHVLAGRPGTGKTTIGMALAATISRGGRWPDGSPAECGNVLIWSGEDDPKDTLVPRLIANGADMEKIYFVGESIGRDGKAVTFDPAAHMPALELEALRIGEVRLLIVNPVVSAVPGDGNSNTEVRRALQPIVDLAARVNCAALGVSHFTKGSDGRDVVERVTGSLAFGASARVVMAAAKSKGEENSPAQRIIARAKSNRGPDSGGYGYELEQIDLPDHPRVRASRVLLAQAMEGSARDLLATAEADSGEGTSAQCEAVDWLRGLLHDNRAGMSRRDVLRSAEAAGFSERTIDRAKKAAGVRTETHGFGQSKRSVWRVEDPPMPPDFRQ